MVNIKKFASYLPDDEEIRSFYEEIFSWPTVDGELEPEVVYCFNVLMSYVVFFVLFSK